eukprot:TRINITY_DN4982_c0_g1_i4.p1 TRINITY_DN4982_c0_g1~~TRINITY_DN4982_c0_g1_i4.p1  ORF type:complete len:1163 (-),score=431.80 TRINITY_DN4982_c0_g1_i4:374-3754(-)
MLHFVRKKSYLASIVFELLLVVCEQVDGERRNATILPMVQYHFEKRALSALSPEEVYFLDTLVRHYFKLDSFPSVRAELKDKKHVVAEDNYPVIEPHLQNSWHTHPKVNPIWKPFLEKLHEAIGDGNMDTEALRVFVRVMDSLVESNSNPRIYLAMNLMQQVAQHNPHAASALFTKATVTFFRDTLQAAKKKLPKNPIQPMGRVTLDTLVDAAAKKPSSSLSAILSIIQHHEGKVNFDVKTGSSTMRTLLASLDTPSFDVYATHLLDRLYESARQGVKGVQEQNRKLHRRNHHGKMKALGPTFSWVLQYIFELCRQREISTPLLRRLLRHMLALAFFKPAPGSEAESSEGKSGKKSKSKSKSKNEGSSDWVAEVGKQRQHAEQAQRLIDDCRERFLSLLPQLSSRTDAPEGDSWASTAFTDFQTLIEHSDEAGLHLTNSSLKEELSSVVNVLDSISQYKKKAESREKKALKGKDKAAALEASQLKGLFETTSILALQLAWQIAGGDHTVSGSLEELEECAKKMISKTKDDEENPYLVLLDLLIAQLTSSVRSIRPLVSAAFRRMCDSLPVEAIEMLLDVVSPGASNAVLEDDGDAMEAEDAAGDGEEEDSDGSDDDSEGADSDAEGKSDESGSESDDSGSDYDPGEGREGGIGAEEARAMFAIAMGEDGEQSDVDLDSQDPDPEELRRFDERMGKLFRQMKERKQAQGKQEEAEKNLKLRVIDLLEIFVKRQSAADGRYIWHVVVPLFQFAVRSEKRKELHSLHARLIKVFNMVCKMKAKAAAGGDIPFDEIHNVQKFFFSQLMGKADLEHNKGNKGGDASTGASTSSAAASGAESSEDEASDDEGEGGEGEGAAAGGASESWRLSPEMKKLCMHGLSMATRVLMYHGKQNRQAFFDLASGLVRAFVFAKNFTNSNLVVISTLFARFPGICWSAQVPLDVLILATHEKERVRSMSFVFITQLLRQGCVAVSRKPLKDTDGHVIDQGEGLKQKYLEKGIAKMCPKLSDALILSLARTAPAWAEAGTHERMRSTKPTRILNVLLCTRALLSAVTQLGLNAEDIVYPSRLREAVNSLANSDMGKRSNKIRVHCTAIMKSLSTVAPKAGSKRGAPSTPRSEKKSRKKRKQ